MRTEKLPPFEREFRFASPRRWRFDFCWPERKLAVEIEGLTPDSGRHQRIGGFIADCEKYEAALRLGWTVYRVPGQWIMKGKRRIWRGEVVETLRELLALHPADATL